MMRTVQAHYIRENQKANVPGRVVVINVQALSTYTGEQEDQVWRCASATFMHWTRNGNVQGETRSFRNSNALWASVDDFCRPKRRTIVYVHNLSQGMRLTRVLDTLPRIGFKLESIRVADAGTWSRWSKAKATLVLCDSMSIFPVSIYTLSTLVGLRFMEPSEDFTEDEWMDKSVSDCAIVARGVSRYFRLLRSGVAGNWQITGAGQSWAHWRHAHYTHPVLVHSDEDAAAAERRAMWTGRAENWVWGRDLSAPSYEWDYSNAYPSIARDYTIPTALRGKVQAIPVGDLCELMDRYAVVADVHVDTAQPVVPTRSDDHILWPVGRFATTLWDPELRLLITSGATVKVDRAWFYKKEPALRQWGEWIVDKIHDPQTADDKWLPIVLKHWSRTLIGRFATQYQNWEEFAWDLGGTVQQGFFFHMSTGKRTDMMQIGNKIYEMTGLTESDDSCPQVTSYVMSVGRARLWGAITAVGPENVLYMDTDSLVLNAVGHRRMLQLKNDPRVEGLRLKHRHRGYEIYGPRAAQIGSELKLAGVPRNARRTSQTTWEGEVWTQMESSIRKGEYDRVTVRARRFSVKYSDRRRERLPDGTTAAHRLAGSSESV